MQLNWSKKVKLPKSMWEKGKSKFLHCRISENIVKQNKHVFELFKANENRIKAWRALPFYKKIYYKITNFIQNIWHKSQSQPAK